jgi:hypothetical protein
MNHDGVILAGQWPKSLVGRPPIDILEPARQQLASAARRAFLAALAHLLTITARNAYPQAGATLAQTTTGLRCHNELLHTVLGRLCADLGLTPGYPDGVFLSILVEKADRNGCGGELHWALQQAIHQPPIPAIDHPATQPDRETPPT